MSTFKDLPNVPRAATILRRFKDRVYVHAREFGFQDTIECSGMIATNGGIVDDVVTDESSHFVVAKVRPRSGRITLTDGIPSLITRSKKAMMLAVCRIEFANGLQWIPDPTMNLPIPTTQEDIRQEADGQTPRPPIAIRMKLFPPRFSKLIVGEMGYVGDLRGTLVDTMADSGRTGRSMQDLVEGQMGDNGKGGTGDGVSIDDSHITQHPSKQLKRQIPETPAPPLPQPEQATETLTSTKTGATSVETLLDVDLPPASPISIYQPPLGQSTVPSPFLAATKPLAHPPVLTRTRPDPAQSMTASFGPLSVRPILHFPFRPSLPIGKAGSLPPINPAPAGTRFTTPSLPPPVGRNMHAESLSAYGLVGGSSKTASAGLAVPIRLAPMLDPALKVVGLAGMWMASGAAHDASLGGGSMGGRSGAREKRLADDTGSGTAPASKRSRYM